MELVFRVFRGLSLHALPGPLTAAIMTAPRSWIPIQPADRPAPAGAYSPAVRAGNLLFVSGQTPRDPESGALVGNDAS